MKTYDLRVRATSDPSGARKDIVLVGIDDSSIARLEPLVGRWPWPRMIHANLIDYLARGPARVVAYDVLFTERDRRTGFAVGDQTVTGEESDRALAESVARAGTVVMLTDVTFGGLDSGPAPGVPETVPRPPVRTRRLVRGTAGHRAPVRRNWRAPVARSGTTTSCWTRTARSDERCRSCGSAIASCRR